MVVFRRCSAVALATLLAGCALGPDRVERFHREAATLRPGGYGLANYGLALDCVPGSCAEAQRRYHAKLRELEARHQPRFHPLVSSVLPYAEAVAGRVDNGEISKEAAEGVIQEFRFRVSVELEKLRAAHAQADAATWAAFWQAQGVLMQQQATTQRFSPITCSTNYVGTVAYTTCR